MEFIDLKGVTLASVAKVDNGGDDELHFVANDGRHFKLYHSQNCCENVYIESIEGDLGDLVGNPILVAEEVSSEESRDPSLEYDSFTWTFYKLATIKGYVDIRWFGLSNGYYSERVDFIELTN